MKTKKLPIIFQKQTQGDHGKGWINLTINIPVRCTFYQLVFDISTKIAVRCTWNNSHSVAKYL